MSQLIVTMGISGSGKSLYSRDMESRGFIRVCMDDLRKLYTGSISDQTQNSRVADSAFTITEFLLSQNKNVIFDSTATRSDTRKTLLKIAKAHNADTKLVVFMDSTNMDLCRSRVAKDQDKKIDRSDTITDSTILQRQHDAFQSSLKAIGTEGWDTIADDGGVG